MKHVSPPQLVQDLLTTSCTSFMAPYDFSAADADAILCSSDGIEFRVHKVILSLASPVFQDVFGLPQPTDPRSPIPVIDILEPSNVLRPFIQYLYPCSPPKVSDISMWEALYTTADKYIVEVVTDLLRDMLVSRFLEQCPQRVYTLAMHWGFEEEAKTAYPRTLPPTVSVTFNVQATTSPPGKRIHFYGRDPWMHITQMFLHLQFLQSSSSSSDRFRNLATGLQRTRSLSHLRITLPGVVSVQTRVYTIFLGLLTRHGYPATVKLPANTVVKYKYVRKCDNHVSWASDPNWSWKTPASGIATLNDNWR